MRAFLVALSLFLPLTSFAQLKRIYPTVITTVDPTVDDDTGDGYVIGHRWINTTEDQEFVALDVTAGAAVWVETTAAGGGGSGDVVGPASSTDNGLARFDGTGGKTLQNSCVTVSDDGTSVSVGCTNSWVFVGDGATWGPASAQTNAVALGKSALAAGTSVVIGHSATAGTTTGVRNAVVIGPSASGTGVDNTIVGASASSSNSDATVIGKGATVTGNQGTAIGEAATAAARGIALGMSSNASADMLSIGSASANITSVVIGYGGPNQNNPPSITVRPTDSNAFGNGAAVTLRAGHGGTSGNYTGGNLDIAGGNGKGTSAGGDVGINAGNADGTGADGILRLGANVAGTSNTLRTQADAPFRTYRIISATPAEPYTCDATGAGTIAYVDDNDDAAAAQLCACIAITDSTYDWRKADDLATACSFF